jgi:hypothetical protein
MDSFRDGQHNLLRRFYASRLTSEIGCYDEQGSEEWEIGTREERGIYDRLAAFERKWRGWVLQHRKRLRQAPRFHNQNDGDLLRPETVDQMFLPHLADSTHLMRMHTYATPLQPGLAVHIPKATRVDYGLGGLLNLEDITRTGRRAGGLRWGGIPNLFWWINRKDGVCGCYFEQLMPAGDEKSFEMFERYERAVNESFINRKMERL